MVWKLTVDRTRKVSPWGYRGMVFIWNSLRPFKLSQSLDQFSHVALSVGFAGYLFTLLSYFALPHLTMDTRYKGTPKSRAEPFGCNGILRRSQCRISRSYLTADSRYGPSKFINLMDFKCYSFVSQDCSSLTHLTTTPFLNGLP